MSSQTTNLGLYKPDMSDTVSTTIPQLSSNFDKIDSSLADIIHLMPSPTGTDDTQNFINALNALKANGGGKLKFPSGTFYLGNVPTIDETYGTIHIEGNGINNTKIEVRATQTINGVFNFNGSSQSNSIRYCKVSDLTIDRTDGNASIQWNGIHLSNASNCEINRVKIHNATMYGILIEVASWQHNIKNVYIDSCGSACISFKNGGEDSLVENSDFRYSGLGCELNSMVRAVKFVKCDFSYNTTGISLYGLSDGTSNSAPCQLIGLDTCDFENCSSFAIKSSNNFNGTTYNSSYLVNSLNIQNCRFVNFNINGDPNNQLYQKGTCIEIDAGQDFIIKGNKIDGYQTGIVVGSASNNIEIGSNGFANCLNNYSLNNIPAINMQNRRITKLFFSALGTSSTAMDCLDTSHFNGFYITNVSFGSVNSLANGKSVTLSLKGFSSNVQQNITINGNGSGFITTQSNVPLGKENNWLFYYGTGTSGTDGQNAYIGIEYFTLP